MTAVHPKKRKPRETFHIIAPCTGNKPFVFHCRVQAYAKLARLEKMYPGKVTIHHG